MYLIKPVNKKGQLHVIKVIFIALFFIIIFGLLASTITDSSETYTNKWADDYPFEAWLISGINVWIMIGGLIGIIAMLVFGTGIAK